MTSSRYLRLLCSSPAGRVSLAVQSAKTRTVSLFISDPEENGEDPFTRYSDAGELLKEFGR